MAERLRTVRDSADSSESHASYRFVKRVLDVAFNLLVRSTCAFLWPAVPIVCEVSTVQRKTSPVYFQRRVGKDDIAFKCLKLRTMVGDADDVGKYLDPDQLDQWRRERKVDADPRITKVGRILRKTSLDELPQFLNVLAGQIPLRILKTRPEFSEESMGAFALPAKSSTNKEKTFSQVASCFANGLRMRRISELNCKRVGSTEGKFLAKLVFGAVGA